MADLEKAGALAAWMRSQRPPVLHARLGDVELWLSPETPAPVAVATEEQPFDEAADYRRSIETLLYSSGADPTPFLAGRG